MTGVFFGGIFDARVIYTKGKCSFACPVVLEAWRILHGFIPIGEKFLYELFEHIEDGFFEAVHATEYFYPIIFNMEVVFVYGLLRDHSVVHTYVLEIRHGSEKVEFIDVKSKIAGSMFGI